jgi:hypothetical protein
VKTRYIKRFVTGLTIFLLSGIFVFAQEEMELKLKHSDEFAPIPKSGEFSLSLDSQLFDSSLTQAAISRPLNTNLDDVSTGLELKSLKLPLEIDSQPVMPEEISISSLAEERKFPSTLTLTTGYSQLSTVDSRNEGLRLEKKLGKFKILGEFEKQTITRIPLPQSSPSFSANANSGVTRASLLNSPTPENDPQSKNSALASRYYLEAVYSFKPSLQGKLSYRRSMIDTIESEEELQVEGIVEANRNVLIKAGYNNETRPEVNEPKATKDSKVWTEFILKF